MMFEPAIVAFLCNWCAYEGADSAGRKRLTCPPNIKIVRILCSGRISPEYIMEALSSGADGVMILGCHPGECHYKRGNFEFYKRLVFLKRLLSLMGVDEDRISFEHVGATEGERFSELACDMVERIRRLGPYNPSVQDE